MKNCRLAVTGVAFMGLVVTLSLFFVPPNDWLCAQADKTAAATQMLVSVRVDGGSFLMVGDPLRNEDKAMDGAALPALLGRGWRIVSVNMTGSAGVNAEQQSALVLLEKSAK